MKLEYTLKQGEGPKSVKHILKTELRISERLVKRLKYSGQVFLNSAPARVNDIAVQGDTVTALIDFKEENINIIPQEMDVDILFEDEWLIAVNKKAGVVVHPTFNHPDGTIANALMNYFIKNNDKCLIRPVSRLDRETSGIIIFAKNQYIQDSLIKQMSSGEFKKGYLGIVHGNVSTDSATIDLPIARKPDSIMLRHVSSAGAASITHFKVLERYYDATFLEFSLETGRTHQIRVHCQSIGHSLVGDSLYPPFEHMDPCPLCSLIPRQALHSYKVEFHHPFTKIPVKLESPIPDDISSLMEILKK